MADTAFEEEVRRSLGAEAAVVPVPPPDLGAVRADARRQGRAPVVLLAAASVALIGLAAAVAVGVLDGRGTPAVVLDGGATPTAADAEELVGRTFASVGALEGAPVPAGALHLAFAPGGGEVVEGATVLAVMAWTDPGCEGESGQYALDGGGGLARVTDAVPRTATCEDEAVAMDTWLRDLLMSGPRLLVAGERLVVDAGDVAVELEAGGPVQPGTPDLDADALVAGLPTAVPMTARLADRCEAAADEAATALAEALVVMGGAGIGPGDGAGDVPADERAAVEAAGAESEVALDRAVAADGCARAAVVDRVVGLLLERLASLDPASLEAVRPLAVLVIERLSDEVPTGDVAGTEHVVPPSPQPTETVVTSGPTSTGFRADSAWCAELGYVGAAVTAEGALVAVCADGSRPVIDAGTSWVAVDAAADRVVATRQVDAGREVVEMRAVDEAEVARTPAEVAAVAGGGLVAVGSGAFVGWIQDGQALGEVAVDAPATAVDWDRAGRWLLATTAAEDGTSGVMAVDTSVSPSPRPVAVPGLLAAAGEVDTPSNVVLLVDRDGQVALEAAFVDADPVEPFGLARTDLASAGFRDGAFVEPLGLLAPEPDGRWVEGSSIGWLVGDGQTVWYVDGRSTTVVADGVRDLAVAGTG